MSFKGYWLNTNVLCILLTVFFSLHLSLLSALWSYSILEMKMSYRCCLMNWSSCTSFEISRDRALPCAVLVSILRLAKSMLSWIFCAYCSKSSRLDDAAEPVGGGAKALIGMCWNGTRLWTFHIGAMLEFSVANLLMFYAVLNRSIIFDFLLYW